MEFLYPVEEERMKLNWTMIYDNAFVFLFCLLLIAISLLVVLCSLVTVCYYPKETLFTVMSLGSILFSGILIYGLTYEGLFTSFNTTDNEKMIISKAEEVLDAREGYIPKGQGPLHYTVTINKENYTFALSETGVNVDKIYKNQSVIYESEKENVDEWLTSIQKVATAKVREITGNQSALIEDYISHGKYAIESENKLYTVKVDSKDEEVEYVLHNDTYVYKK